MDKKEYQRIVNKRAARSPVFKNTLHAFFIGGGICLLGEGMRNGFLFLGVGQEDAPLLVTVALVFLSVFLTSVGVYDRIARVGGAGTLVPVTGFANAVASPALDLRAEGPVLGIGAGIFKVAGPVLLFSTLSGSLYGLIFWLSEVVL